MSDPSPFPDGELASAAELGAIDDRRVRIWIRSPHHERVHGVLDVAGFDPVAGSIDVSAVTDWTGVLELALPAPAPTSEFTCSVLGRRLHGRFSPAAGERSHLTFGFGSCHLPFLVRGDSLVVSDHARDFYPAMVQELEKAKTSRLMLIGDQIYADALEPVSVLRDTTGTDREVPTVEETLDQYRRVYRGFFAQQGIRRLRETFPTLCVWDDGDVYDNWGSVRGDDALDRRLFTAASRAYCEYQHSRNPGGGIGDPPYCFRAQYGDIGFFALDLRGARSAENTRLMGAQQWDLLVRYLRDETQPVLTLFVISSVPVEHGSRWFTRLGERLPERWSGPVRERWVSRHFVESRDSLLDVLFDWASADRRRQVVILSGDVHCASAFEIRRRDLPTSGIIQQFTSSAMTTPLSAKQAFFNRVAVRAPNLFERRFHLRRKLLSISNNFGIVHVEPHPDGGHRVSFTVHAWDKRAGKLRTAGRVVAEPPPRQ